MISCGIKLMCIFMYSGESSFEFVQKFPIFAGAYFASFVEIVLLRCIFIVSRLALSVLVLPLYSGKLSPIVSLILFISFFCDLMLQ